MGMGDITLHIYMCVCAVDVIWDIHNYYLIAMGIFCHNRLYVYATKTAIMSWNICGILLLFCHKSYSCVHPDYCMPVGDFIIIMISQ